MFRIAIEELYRQGKSLQEITSEVVVEYVRERFGAEIAYNENVSREVARLKKLLLKH
jgi:cytochrome c-type biogenesis protein CcmH/NrfF